MRSKKTWSIFDWLVVWSSVKVRLIFKPSEDFFIKIHTPIKLEVFKSLNVLIFEKADLFN